MFRSLLRAFAARSLLRAVRRQNADLTRQLAGVHLQLEQERIRHRQREESLLDRVLSATKLPALPALPVTEAETKVMPAAQPRKLLSDHDHMLREAYAAWAVEAGHSKEQGYLRFDSEHGATAH